MSARMETRVRMQQLQQNAPAKVEFKGPVTKWEKKWVTVGHLKLFRWTPASRSKKVNVTMPQNTGTTQTAQTFLTERQQKMRPFNEYAPITRSVTSTHKNIKDALITTLETKRHALKGTKRGQSAMNNNTILNSDSNLDEPGRKELKSENSNLEASLPSQSSPTQPIRPEDSVSSPVTPTSEFAQNKAIQEEESQEYQEKSENDIENDLANNENSQDNLFQTESQDSQYQQSENTEQYQENSSQLLPPMQTHHNTQSASIDNQEKSEDNENDNENSNDNESSESESESESEEGEEGDEDDDQYSEQ
eukprot:TRINITY_DN222_c0_g2_i1.p1 TRINITY_DN222_c0_g2~~TRINITY_DN222_c0_g2_i1.p1  ORF type:complete len:306 (-),score=79.22 TRINITY_DN222_c0_g2_i1:271-1188(-)